MEGVRWRLGCIKKMQTSGEKRALWREKQTTEGQRKAEGGSGGRHERAGRVQREEKRHDRQTKERHEKGGECCEKRRDLSESNQRRPAAHSDSTSPLNTQRRQRWSRCRCSDRRRRRGWNESKASRAADKTATRCKICSRAAGGALGRECRLPHSRILSTLCICLHKMTLSARAYHTHMPEATHKHTHKREQRG